jgi:hypothetical protein
MRYYVNLFGESLRYWICDIPKETYDFMKQIKDEKQCEWENLFYDFDFLNSFGFNHWSELSESPEYRGFLIGENNRIEVKTTKKVLKITSNELIQDTLFPLYQVSKINQIKPNLAYKRFILIQFETGQFAKYSFHSEKFDVNNLEFLLQELDFGFVNHLLVTLKYNNKTLDLLQEDTLIKKMMVIEI